jgi:hypothetical protein
MKKILIVETVDRLMPIFLKLTNEYFGSCSIYVLRVSNDLFEICEFESKLLIKKGNLASVSNECGKIGIEFLCIDNYISFNNLRIVNNFKNINRVIFQIGLYISADVVGYAYIRFGFINVFSVCFETIFFKIKHNIWSLKLFLFKSVEYFFYEGATVVFWNQLSEDKFKRYFPIVKTANILLFENANKKFNVSITDASIHRIIFTPSLLGSKNENNTEVEFMFWENLASVLLMTNPNLHFSLSIHPLYVDKLSLFEELNMRLNVFNEIFCGFNVENNSYDLLITDLSTLYWIAPLYGLRSERVNNLFIHKKYME